MKILIKTTLLLVLSCGLAWSSYSLYRSPLFLLETVNLSYNDGQGIEGAYKVYIESLKPQVELALVPFKGKSLWDLSIEEVEKKVSSLSWVESVIVSRRFPSEISIDIQTKKILANILQSPTKVRPIGYDHEILEDAAIVNAPLVPILSGKAFARDEHLRARALKLLKELPAEGSFSYGSISEVYPHRNDEFKILLKYPKAIVMINTDNVPLKAARISKVIDYMDPLEMKGRVIDSSFSKKVLVKPRNHR